MSISIQDFKAQIGSSFIAHTHSGMLELKLLEADELPRRGLPERFATPLSLVFTGPVTMLLSQDSYYLDHPVLGRNQWMLVPISKYATPQFAGTGSDGDDNLPLYEVILS